MTLLNLANIQLRQDQLDMKGPIGGCCLRKRLVGGQTTGAINSSEVICSAGRPEERPDWPSCVSLSDGRGGGGGVGQTETPTLLEDRECGFILGPRTAPHKKLI